MAVVLAGPYASYLHLLQCRIKGEGVLGLLQHLGLQLVGVEILYVLYINDLVSCSS